MAAPLLMALAGAGVALNAYSTWKAGREEAQSLLELANEKRLAANEVIARNKINNQLLFLDAKTVIGEQVSRAAASGAGGATNMAIFEETATLAARQIKLNTRAAEWEARALFTEAGGLQRTSGQVLKGSQIQTIAGLFTGFAKIAMAAPGAEKNPGKISTTSSAGGASPISNRISGAPSLLATE